MTAAFDWSPGGCCCYVIGVWDWYHAVTGSGETQGYPYLARTASVYPGTNTGTPDDYESYPEWYAEIENSGAGANFQDKSILTSIAPLAGGNNVYYYAQAGAGEPDEKGTIIMKSGNPPSVIGIVTDQDWDDIGAEPLGSTVNTVFGFAGGTPSASGPFESFAWNDLMADSICCHADGMVRYRSGMSSSLPSLWEINIEPGDIVDIAYVEYEEGERGINGPAYGNFPGFSDAFMPVGFAPQAYMVAGIRMPYVPSRLTGTPVEGEEYEANIEINVGQLAADDDLYEIFKVVGTTVWTLAKTYTDRGGFDLYDDIWARVDQFDATALSHIFLITYGWEGNWSTSSPYYPGSIEFHQCLVIDGHEVGSERIVYSTAASDTADWVVTGTDNSAFYPFWYNPRALQPTDETDSFPNRFIVFKRKPFNQGEADASYGSSSTIATLVMQCYFTSGDVPTLEWQTTARYGLAGVASGDMELSTTNNATLSMTAIRGGDADGEIGDDFAHIELHQATSEKTEYNVGDDTLHVYIDIAGGHDTVDDLVDVIQYGGDWRVTFHSFGGDTITASDTGSPVAPFTGGNSTPNVISPIPYVVDSSDRHFYVVNFPLRIYQRVSNGLSGNVRRACFPGGANDNGYPTVWRISHNGEHADPCGKGTERWNRLGPDLDNPTLTGGGFSCVKNLRQIPQSPAEDVGGDLDDND